MSTILSESMHKNFGYNAAMSAAVCEHMQPKLPTIQHTCHYNTSNYTAFDYYYSSATKLSIGLPTRLFEILYIVVPTDKFGAR